MDTERVIVAVEIEDTGRDACEWNIEMDCGHWSFKNWTADEPQVGDTWPCAIC